MIQGITINPPPTLFLILAVMVGIILGWLMGYFDSNTRTSKKIQAAETRAENTIAEAEKKIAAVQAQPKSNTQAIPDEPGLLRLKNVDGIRYLEMDGAPLNVKSVSPDQKKRLIELLTFIRPWVDGGGQPLPPVARPAAPAPVQPADAAFKPTPTQPLAPLKPAEEKNIRSLSIVAQIDTVLQTLLTNTHLATRGIRLTESSMGGVEVYIGLDKYGSLDEVPEGEIKTVIRSAISEWEDKFTPGA